MKKYKFQNRSQKNSQSCVPLRETRADCMAPGPTPVYFVLSPEGGGGGGELNKPS